MILSYTRNKEFDVEPMGADGLAVRWRLVDSHLDMEIRMEIRFPDLEITKIDVCIERSPHPECKAVEALSQKVVGVRIGGGLREIVIGLIGGGSGCGELTQGVLDCCNGVILHFTVPELKTTEGVSGEEHKKKVREMLLRNPRLARSCVAFADGSPLMENLGL